MRKIIVFFISSVLVLNSFTTTALASSILNKTKIHEITSCESVLNSSFEAYIECLNDQVFTSKHFLKLSKNKKNDIQSLLAIANILSENIEDEFLSKPKAVSIWNKIINYPYKDDHSFDFHFLLTAVKNNYSFIQVPFKHYDRGNSKSSINWFLSIFQTLKSLMKIYFDK